MATTRITLVREHGLPEAEEGSPPDVIVPAFYNFPDAAKLLSLSFVLCAAWYSDTALSLTDYPGLAFAGVATLIGSVNVAIPFLLDLMRIPADTFNLFIATGILNSRFGALTSAMYMVAIALTGAHALTGKLRLSTSRILYYGVVTVGLAVLIVMSLISLRAMGGHEYDKDRIAMGMQFLRTPAARRGEVKFTGEFASADAGASHPGRVPERKPGDGDTVGDGRPTT